jgi:HlyD family secretion protein
MELEKERGDRRRTRIIQIVFIVFMGMLLFFTLFSNTLQSLTLPKVRTEKAANGSLIFTIESSGILQPFAEMRLSNPADWKVRKILVKEGDRVMKGQQLIIYDSTTAERELEDQLAYLEKQKIELQNVQDQFIQLNTEGDEFKIRNARRNIETLKLDLGVQERKINELRDRLTNQREMIAPYDGIINKLNAIEGVASTGDPDALISNSSLGYRLDISADATLLSSLGISVGDKVEVKVHTTIDTEQAQQIRMIDGTIDEIAPAEPLIGSSNGETGLTPPIPQKSLRIRLADSELRGGEKAEVKLEKRSQQEGLVLSNEAIHEDSEGTFVYKIEEMRGTLGNSYMARKVRIRSSEANGKKTMIQADNLYMDELIIMESSEPLQDGNRVRLQ